MQPFVIQPGDTGEEYIAHVVAVYDPKTGRVVHAHHELRLAKNAQPDATTLANAALEHARDAGHDVTALTTVALGELRRPGSYAIDVKKRTPIDIAAPVKQRGARRPRGRAQTAPARTASKRRTGRSR